MKTGGPIRGLVSRWLMRLEASQQIFRIAFLGITAASTLTSALAMLGHQALAPYILGAGVLGSPAFAYAYVELGFYNRKNRERQDRGDNFAGPGMAMGNMLRARQLATAIAAMEDGKSEQELLEELENVTQEQLRQFRNGIDLETIYNDDPAPSKPRQAIADGGTVIAPRCTQCDKTGVPGQHKGNDVVECPDCQSILFRGVEA